MGYGQNLEKTQVSKFQGFKVSKPGAPLLASFARSGDFHPAPDNARSARPSLEAKSRPCLASPVFKDLFASCKLGLSGCRTSRLFAGGGF